MDLVEFGPLLFSAVFTILCIYFDTGTAAGLNALKGIDFNVIV